MNNLGPRIDELVLEGNDNLTKRDEHRREIEDKLEKAGPNERPILSHQLEDFDEETARQTELEWDFAAEAEKILENNYQALNERYAQVEEELRQERLRHRTDLNRERERGDAAERTNRNIIREGHTTIAGELDQL